MPAVSLVVCAYSERELLERLLQKSQGCYDELIVIHDGPDTFGVRVSAEQFHGRFFEQPRAFQQERHLPFAFAQATHDWILHFDADELPSDELKDWLVRFRTQRDPGLGVPGYTCIWPLWNGKKAVSKKTWGRIFLFNRSMVRFFGMAEQAMIPDGKFEPLDMVLHHQPRRKSYGFYNVLIRKQAYRWRAVIAQSLLGKPTDLPCWRWESEQWPEEWEVIRRRPFRTALSRLVLGTYRALRSNWRADRRFYPLIALNGPVHHALICLKFWQVRRQHLRERNNPATIPPPTS
jgi:Glycosyl transferase family 2